MVHPNVCAQVWLVILDNMFRMHFHLAWTLVMSILLRAIAFVLSSYAGWTDHWPLTSSLRPQTQFEAVLSIPLLQATDRGRLDGVCSEGVLSDRYMVQDPSHCNFMRICQWRTAQGETCVSLDVSDGIEMGKCHAWILPCPSNCVYSWKEPASTDRFQRQVSQTAENPT